MNNIYIKTKGPESWKDLLVEPEKQWKTGYSAKSLAYSWESQDGFPLSFQKAFNDSALDIEILLGIPEYKVYLDTKKAPSQNDLFVLAKDKSGLISIMVEGKVSESFDKLVKDWFNNTKSREERLKFLLKKLNLCKTISAIGDFRYQLFHRTVSAIITAEKFNAKKAIMIVHSFSEDNLWFDDYSKFLTLLNPNIKKPIVGKIYKCTTLLSGIELHIAWIKGDKKYLSK